jgi:hypothetical protein
MKSMHMLTAAIVANLAILAVPVSASAKLVLETATYTGNDAGEYIVQDGRWIGAAFTLSSTQQITSVGGQFGGFPGGMIFAAMVPLASQTSLPNFTPSDIETYAIADVVFSVPQAVAIDYTVPLSVTLPAGSYAVIFGSGAFGASGFAGLGDLNDVVGTPNWANTFFDDAWDADSYDGVRITLTAAPEPSTWAMLLVGFAGLAFVSNSRMRRSRATA